MPPAKTLLIVYHSSTDGTHQMAQALRAGADQEIAVRILPATQAGPEDLRQADGYVFACPEHLAALSGLMKDFFDRCYYPLLDQIQGRPYASLICAGSDGQNAARQMAKIATGWRLKPVAGPLIVCTQAQSLEAIAAIKHISQADLQRCRDLGQALAAGIALGIF